MLYEVAWTNQCKEIRKAEHLAMIVMRMVSKWRRYYDTTVRRQKIETSIQQLLRVVKMLQDFSDDHGIE